MNLTTWSTWAGLAHHPEVVLLVARHDVDGRVQAGLLEDARPDGMGLPVELGGIALPGVVDRCVEPIGGEIPGIHEQFPAPLDGFFLEIVAE